MTHIFNTAAAAIGITATAICLTIEIGRLIMEGMDNE